jgi:SsrA-binding protein
MAMATAGTVLIAQNKRARHDYEIVDALEAGIVLSGSEVKSMRTGQVQMVESFARIRDGEVWMEGVHIPPYRYAVGVGAHDPDRSRKLLLHRTEIRKLAARVDAERVALVPLRLYFKDGKAKVELGIGKGRTKADKRQAIAERDSEREIRRELGRRAKRSAS